VNYHAFANQEAVPSLYWSLETPCDIILHVGLERGPNAELDPNIDLSVDYCHCLPHKSSTPVTRHRIDMSSVLASIVAFYDYTLQPVSALAWVGIPISTLDIAGAFRLALILRQLRELFRQQHLAKMSTSDQVKGVPVEPLEQRSRVRDFSAALVMVFGGEAVVGALKIRYGLPSADLGLVVSHHVSPGIVPPPP
jgi:hypothetical protein